MTACNTETAVCIAPVNGTLALVVFLRLGFGRCKSLAFVVLRLLLFLVFGLRTLLEIVYAWPSVALLMNLMKPNHQTSRRAAFSTRSI